MDTVSSVLAGAGAMICMHMSNDIIVSCKQLNVLCEKDCNATCISLLLTLFVY